MPAFDAARVAELYESDPYAKWLGIELVSVSDVELVIALDVGERHVNFLGGGHGGMMFSVADCAFSLAANSPGPRAVAIDTHMVFTAGVGIGDRLTATAVELTRGRTLGTYRITLTRGDGRTAGIFTGTVHIAAES